MNFDDVTIHELVQMCMLVESKSTKEKFLALIARNLKKENFLSLDQTMRHDIKVIFSQLYNNDLMILFERIFQHDSTSAVEIDADKKQKPNLSEINQGIFLPVSNDPPSNLTLVPIDIYAPSNITVKLEPLDNVISDSSSIQNMKGQAEKLSSQVQEAGGNPEFNQICRKRSASQEPQTSSSIGDRSEE